jgi:predicted amidohydrolase YtcJ
MASTKQLLAAALAVLFTHGIASAQDRADLILTGGKIATLRYNEGFVEALAVKNGRVLAVGSDDEVLRFKGESTRVIELAGRTVIPGLNDSHLHVVRGGRFYNLELRWDGVPSLRRGLEMVREQAGRTPKGQWVRVVGGWSPYQFEERRMPTIAELNQAAPDTPVFVMFLYSKGFLNRAGVEALGINEDTKPPKGTRYKIVDGGAELLAEPSPAILYQTIAALPQLSDENQVNSTLHFYRELNRFGLTSATDAGGGGHLFPTNYVATRRLAEQGKLPIRISFFLFPQRPGKELEDFHDWTSSNQPGVNIDIVHQNGYVLQGGGETLVWSAGDYENFLAPRPSLQQLMDRHLEEVTTLLVKNGWSFRIHATYGESIDRILEVFERVNAEQPFNGLRWAIDHGETMHPDQIQRIQRLGGGVAVQDRMAFAGEFFLERYGKAAAANAPPLRKLLEAGIPVGAGSDATRVSSHNPWVSLYWMVSGKTIGGTVLYPPEQRLTRTEALRLYTVGSAWLSGEESRKGTLKPGQYADLAVLSADYFTVPEESIRSIESVLTIVGGQPVYAANPYADLSPKLPAAAPSWSPVGHMGGYFAAKKELE